MLDAVSLFPRRAETAIVADLVKGAIDRGLDECVEKGMLSLEGALVQFRHELARRAIEASIAPARRQDEGRRRLARHLPRVLGGRLRSNGATDARRR